jgi:hypothetical protein
MTRGNESLQEGVNPGRLKPYSGWLRKREVDHSIVHFAIFSAKRH